MTDTKQRSATCPSTIGIYASGSFWRSLSQRLVLNFTAMVSASGSTGPYLKSFYQPALRRKIYKSVEDLQTDLDEWLDQHLFESIAHARETATQWLWRYNNERPNIAIVGITPIQKLIMAA